ncbi:MAG: Rab family GTPase [Promethearchaeota archaeon]
MHLDPSKEKKPLKIVLLGEGGVGKTTISKSYIDNYFFMKSKQTIAVEFHSKIIKHSDKRVSKLQIWDLGGQEHFKQMGVFGEFCKGADAALLCFDLTDLSSLFNLSEWLEFIAPSIPRFLIGTKSDLATEDEKKFSLTRYTQRFNCVTSFKCSAKDIKTVMSIFERVLLTIERKNSNLGNISSDSNTKLSNKLLVS